MEDQVRIAPSVYDGTIRDFEAPGSNIRCGNQASLLLLTIPVMLR